MCSLNINIKVERRSNNPTSPFLKLFERVIKYDSSLTIPYNSLLESLRFLYGKDAIVSFSIEYD